MTRYYRIDTPAGVLVAWSNGRREDGSIHVGVRTEWDHNRHEHYAPVGGWDGVADRMRFCRVDYAAHEHYAYSPGADGGTGARLVPTGVGNPLSRVDQYAPGSDAAVRAFRAAVQPAILEWLATDAGRAMLADGERDRVADARRRLTARRAELADQLAAVDGELAALPAVD